MMKRERRKLRRSRLAVLQCRKRKNIKVLLDFFQKIAESRGSAFGRPPQRAKSPSVPKRHPQMAQSPRQSRKAAIPTPLRVADGGLLGVAYTVVHRIGAQS